MFQILAILTFLQVVTFLLAILLASKVESEKVGLKLNIQKTKIMASGLITSWEIDGATVETVSDFIFWGSKITADGDCSHEIKRRLSPWVGPGKPNLPLGLGGKAGGRPD